jgi:FtsH-binding integral membrane protein
MFGRLLNTIRSERQLSAIIRAHLVDGLFHPFASFVTGVIIGFAIAALMHTFTEDLVLRNMSYVLAIVSLARLVTGMIYLRRNRPIGIEESNRWEFAFFSGAALFTLCLGLLTFFALIRVDSTEVHLILTITAAGYGSIIAARNAGRPILALTQLYLTTVPMWIALILQPHYGHWQRALAGAV